MGFWPGPSQGCNASDTSQPIDIRTVGDMLCTDVYITNVTDGFVGICLDDRLPARLNLGIVVLDVNSVTVPRKHSILVLYIGPRYVAC